MRKSRLLRVGPIIQRPLRPLLLGTVIPNLNGTCVGPGPLYVIRMSDSGPCEVGRGVSIFSCGDGGLLWQCTARGGLKSGVQSWYALLGSLPPGYTVTCPSDLQKPEPRVSGPLSFR